MDKNELYLNMLADTELMRQFKAKLALDKYFDGIILYDRQHGGSGEYAHVYNFGEGCQIFVYGVGYFAARSFEDVKNVLHNKYAEYCEIYYF